MLQDLKKKSLSGVKWTSVAAVASAGLQICQLIVLTRFLSPAEYGVWGILSVLIGFSYVFVDMGLSNAIIHFQKIEPEQLSSLYWLNVIAGVTICLILCGLAPLLAIFYKTRSLLQLIPIIALTFVVIPFGQQYQSLLQKDLQFRKIALIETGTKFIGFIFMLILLFLGLKLHAVAWSTVATAALASVLFWSTGNQEHRPQFILNISRVHVFLKFGTFQMLDSTTNYFNIQIDSLLIGRLLGLEALGLYTLAKNLVLRPMFIINSIITRVTFPMMAKVQDDTALLRLTYLKTVAYLSAVNFPLYMFLAFFAGPFVALVFGEKWVGSVLVLQILSFWAAIRSAGNPVGSLVLAKGRTDISFYWNLSLLLVIPATIFIGCFFKLEGVCYGLLAIQVILAVPSWYFLVFRLCKAGLGEYLMEIVRPFLLALGAVLGAFCLTVWIPSGVFYLAAALVVFLAVYWVLTIKFNPAFLNVVGELIHKNL